MGSLPKIKGSWTQCFRVMETLGKSWRLQVYGGHSNSFQLIPAHPSRHLCIFQGVKQQPATWRDPGACLRSESTRQCNCLDLANLPHISFALTFLSPWPNNNQPSTQLAPTGRNIDIKRTSSQQPACKKNRDSRAGLLSATCGGLFPGTAGQ